MDYADVTIIGGGITGAAIARELSRFKLDVIIVERGGELAAGASKATLGHIYTGLNMVGSMILKSSVLPPGTPLTLAALHDSQAKLSQWSEQGFNDWANTLQELGVRHKYSDLLIVAKDREQIADLDKYVSLGKSAGGIYGDFRQIGREQIFTLQPHINPDIVTALHAQNQLIDVFPPELVMAIAENAVQNGVKLMLDSEVLGISKNAGEQIVQTSNGAIKSRFVVNAAGGWADKIADMGGRRDWGLKFNKTQLMILDKRLNGLINGTVRWPNRPGQIELIQQRGENILIECGTYDPTDRPDDTANMPAAMQRGLAIAQSLLPQISAQDVIAAFTGVRTFNTRNIGDHIVEFAADNPAFLNVVIRLPGIIGALPMARYVVNLLRSAGLQTPARPTFKPQRKAPANMRYASASERVNLVAQQPLYGHIVCRCELVSAGEIIDAINSGARTTDGVKFRTRASMGRCQGNFCNAKIAAILAQQLARPITAITKKGHGSNFIDTVERADL